VTAHSTIVDSERLVKLSEEVNRIAGNLAELTMRASSASMTSQSPATRTQNSADTEISADAVRWLIKARRARASYLGNELFAEPAWDILLDLLLAEIAGHRVQVSSLCIAADVPATTGLRWINQMAKRGLLKRCPDPRDGRRVFVELVPEVSLALRRYFADVVQPKRIAG